jgi:hypothetical protein
MGIATIFFAILVFVELENIQHDQNNSRCEEQHLEKLDHVSVVFGSCEDIIFPSSRRSRK